MPKENSTLHLADLLELPEELRVLAAKDRQNEKLCISHFLFPKSPPFQTLYSLTSILKQVCIRKFLAELPNPSLLSGARIEVIRDDTQLWFDIAFESEISEAILPDLRSVFTRLIQKAPIGIRLRLGGDLNKSPVIHTSLSFSHEIHEDEVISSYKRLSNLKPQLIKNESNELSLGNLQKEVRESLPKPSRLIKQAVYLMTHQKHPLYLVLIRIQANEYLKPSLDQWRDELEQKYRVGILLQYENLSEDISSQLINLTDKTGLVRDPEQVKSLIPRIYGKAPSRKHYKNAFCSLGDAADLSSLPFRTIDPEGAFDLDDAFYCEKLGRGTRKVYVAFADVTAVVHDDDPIDKYARKVAFSLYGRRCNIPLLGRELSCDELSLLPNKKRRAWVVEMIIGEGRGVLSHSFYRAWIKTSERLSFNEVGQNWSELPEETQEQLIELEKASLQLRSRRFEESTFLKIRSEGRGYRIVEELMLQSKKLIAEFFAARDIPALYRVHLIPSPALRSEFIKRVKEMGLKVSKKDFVDPLRLRNMLAELREQGHRALFETILDSYLQRAYYDTRNRGHHALGLEAYTEIKALRNYVGLINQRQADRYFRGSELLEVKDMRRFQRLMNRKHRTYQDNMVRLLTFESLSEKLNRVGAKFRAEVILAQSFGAIVNVSGFEIPGFLVEQQDVALREFAPGTQCVVELRGYCPYLRRFIFNPVKVIRGGKSRDVA